MKSEKQTLTKSCMYCDYTVSVQATDKQLEDLKGGALIQNVFPLLTAEKREMFISGMCGKCFDRLFE